MKSIGKVLNMWHLIMDDGCMWHKHLQFFISSNLCLCFFFCIYEARFIYVHNWSFKTQQSQTWNQIKLINWCWTASMCVLQVPGNVSPCVRTNVAMAPTVRAGDYRLVSVTWPLLWDWRVCLSMYACVSFTVLCLNKSLIHSLPESGECCYLFGWCV